MLKLFLSVFIAASAIAANPFEVSPAAAATCKCCCPVPCRMCASGQCPPGQRPAQSSGTESCLLALEQEDNLRFESAPHPVSHVRDAFAASPAPIQSPQTTKPALSLFDLNCQLLN